MSNGAGEGGASTHQRVGAVPLEQSKDLQVVLGRINDDGKVEGEMAGGSCGGVGDHGKWFGDGGHEGHLQAGLPQGSSVEPQIEEKGGTGVLRLFSGKDQSFWQDSGEVVLCLDLQKGQDALNPAVKAYLFQLCMEGKVTGVVGGPPCRSLLVCRYQRPGPEPLRSRGGGERFGLKGLAAEAQMKTHQDSALWLLPMVLFEVTRSVREERGWTGPVFAQENPRDPEKWLGEGEGEGKLDTPPGGYASFWAWPETQEFVKTNGMGMAKFDQGPLGHERRKPTTIMTNVTEVLALHGRCGPGDVVGRSGSTEGRIKESASWAAWAPELKQAVKMGLQRVNHEVMVEMRIKAARLPAKEEQWRRHVENEHVPHRRDCRVCVEAAGRAGGHRRIRAPNSLTFWDQPRRAWTRMGPRRDMRW